MLRAQYYSRPCEPGDCNETRFDTRITILAFTATMVALRDFDPVLAGERLSAESLHRASRVCVELWHAALAGAPELIASA